MSIHHHSPSGMKDEVNCAAGLFVRFVEKADVPKVTVDKFETCLAGLMTKKYQRHWHPQKPQRGSAYRSITIDRVSLDPIIIATLKDVSLDSEMTEKILSKFPKELVLWVDPGEVSYRFGDHGSVGVLYSKQSQEKTSDYESGSSSVESSPRSSPCSTPPSHQYRPQQHPQQQQSAHSIHRQCGRDAWQLSGHAFPPSQCYQYQSTVA